MGGSCYDLDREQEYLPALLVLFSSSMVVLYDVALTLPTGALYMTFVR